MVRIVICDDEPAVTESLSKMLNDIYGDQCHTTCIHTSSALIGYLSGEQTADVLLLDIAFPDVNAIDMVKKIMKPATKLQIIYVTGHIDFCTDVYDTKHVSFLTKPVTAAALKKAVDTAVEEQKCSTEIGIQIKSGGATYILAPKSLVSVESRARCLMLHSDNENIEIYDKLKDFLKMLPPHFLQCHKSYAVNLARVYKFCGDSFVMDDDTSIPISQMRRKEVRESFLKYVEGTLWV